MYLDVHFQEQVGWGSWQEFPCSAGFPTEIPRLAILGKQLATQCVLWYSRLKCNLLLGLLKFWSDGQRLKRIFSFFFLQYLRTLLVSMAVKTGDCSKILRKLIRRTSLISLASSKNLLFYATIFSPPPHTKNSNPVMNFYKGKLLMLVLKLLPWKNEESNFVM